MSSGDNVKAIDQSTAASTGTDSYVSLLKEIVLTISSKPELNPRIIIVSDLPRETAETGIIAADDPPLRDLFRDDRYAATCKTQLPGFACN